MASARDQLEQCGLENAQREDLMQASVVMASFAYHAAMRDEMLPREPMPQELPERDVEEEEDEEP